MSLQKKRPSVLRNTIQGRSMALPAVSQDPINLNLSPKNVKSPLKSFGKSPLDKKFSTACNESMQVSAKKTQNNFKTSSKGKLRRFFLDSNTRSGNLLSPRSLSPNWVSHFLVQKGEKETTQEEESAIWKCVKTSQSGMIENSILKTQINEDQLLKYKNKVLSLLKSFWSFEIAESDESIRVYRDMMVPTCLEGLNKMELDMKAWSIFFMVLTLVQKINKWFGSASPLWKMQAKELEETKKKLRETETKLEKVSSSLLTHGTESKMFKKGKESVLGKLELAKKEKEEAQWVIEKVRLQKEVEELQNQIKNDNKASRLEKLEAENENVKSTAHEMLRKMEVKGKQKDSLISRLEVEKVGLRSLVQTSNSKIKELELVNLELSQKLVQIQKEQTNLEESQRKMKEIAKIKQNEISHMKEVIEIKEEELKRLQKKLVDLQKAVASLNNENSNLTQLRQEEIMEKDEEYLKELREIFTKSQPNFLKRVSLNAEKNSEASDSLSSNRMEGGGSGSRREVRRNSIEEESRRLEGLVYMRPTFYSLIRENYLKFLNEMDSPENVLKKHAALFFGTLRGILDSKYKENSISENKKTVSKFADFAYSFLGTNSVELESRRVKSTIGQPIYTSPDEPRLLFYFSLFAERYDRLWEVRFFRECLEEKLSSDHLLFLLKCRDILFNGPQLSHYSPYEFINYVRWSVIELPIHSIFRRFDGSNGSVIIEKLRKKIKEKNGRRLIDPYFVLKVLSELYLAEENCRFSMFKAIFSRFPSVSKSSMKLSISFENFRKIIEANYSGTSELEKAALYREAYCCGNGLVNPESFMTAARELNFFNEFIRIEGRTPQCRLDLNGDISDSMTEKLYKELQSPIYSTLERFSSEFGCEEFYKGVYLTSQMIRNKFQVDPAALTNQSYFETAFFMVTKNFKAMVLTVLNELNGLKSAKNDQFLEDQLISLMKGFHRLVEKANNLAVLSTAERLHQMKKVVFLQKFLRARYKHKTEMHSILNF